jgi:hypothetical protein
LCLAEKQQIQILQSLTWPGVGTHDLPHLKREY